MTSRFYTVQSPTPWRPEQFRVVVFDLNSICALYFNPMDFPNSERWTPTIELIGGSNIPVRTNEDLQAVAKAWREYKES